MHTNEFNNLHSHLSVLLMHNCQHNLNWHTPKCPSVGCFSPPPRSSTGMTSWLVWNRWPIQNVPASLQYELFTTIDCKSYYLFQCVEIFDAIVFITKLTYPRFKYDTRGPSTKSGQSTVNPRIGQITRAIILREEESIFP